MPRRSGSPHTKAGSTLLAALVLLVPAADLCGGCTTIPALDDDMPGDAGADSRSDDGIGGGGGSELGDAAPAGACDEMDILFVVDDSLSMLEEQANLADNFPAFIEILDERIGGSGQPLDYRVAVTTTGRDVDYALDYLSGPVTIPVSEDGANGAFLDDPACGGPPRRWLERSDPNVSGTFACLAQIGIGGPNVEMPLLVTELAFVDRVADGTNAGFLRPSALHAIVILTDEDDCSRRDDDFVIESIYSDICSTDPAFDDVGRYIDVLDTAAGGRERWAVAVIAGAGPGNCFSIFGAAHEGRRLQRFVTDVGTNAVFSSICEGDLASALARALDTFGAACDSLPEVP